MRGILLPSFLGARELARELALLCGLPECVLRARAAALRSGASAGETGERREAEQAEQAEQGADLGCFRQIGPLIVK